MSFYDDMAAVAAKLLTDKGQTIAFSRDNVIGYNAATMSETTGSAVTFSGVGAAFGFNQSEIDGTTVQQGDKRVILEATDTAPEIGDIATIDSIAHRIINVETVSPAGTPVIYKLQARI